MMKSIPILAATLAFILMGVNQCAGQMTPASVPNEAKRLTPVLYVTRLDSVPPEYARWYAATERCAGLRGDYAKVRWYLTPGPWTGLNGPTYGMWQDGRRITLNKPEWMDSTLVMHEVMHDLLSANDLTDPTDAHPPAYFGPGKCVYRFHP